jgi:predicted O-methyltransferase YrrM
MTDNSEQIIVTIPTAWTHHIHFAKWIVEKKQPKVIVDLGVDYGYSTFCFASLGIGHVYGIDNFEGYEWYATRDTFDYVDNKKKELNFENITLIRGNFDDVVKDWELPIDILHIDGDHKYESVKNDYEKWSKFVKDDGVILFHDTLAHITTQNPSFEVHKFFDEITLPKLNFSCSHGLGVVSKNKRLITEINKTFDISRTYE